MSLAPAARATRNILKEYYKAAASGDLTTGDVVAMVQQEIPDALEKTIYRAIESFGPIGEGDLEWLQKAQAKGVISSWFYTPRTGEPIE